MTLHPALTSLRSSQGGFTLIELLVTIVILGVLLGSTIAGFSQFNERQLVFQSGQSLQSVFRSAQKKATVGDKPAGCTTLQGYRVVGSAGASTYTLNAVCSNNAAIQDSTYTLPAGVTLNQNISLGYHVLTGTTLPSPSPAMSSGYADVYVGNATTGFFWLRVDQAGSLSIPCAKLITTLSPPTCP